MKKSKIIAIFVSVCLVISAFPLGNVFATDDSTDVSFSDDSSNVNFSDDFDAETATEDNPLGNDWEYGTTAIDNISVANSKVTLSAVASAQTRIGSNRVVRPASEARINQKVCVEFDASDFSATSGGANRPRLLLRVKNDPANEGNLVAYYADIDWNDAVRIGRFYGAADENDKYFGAIKAFTKLSKTTTGIYRFEFYAEQINSTTTKLTARCYKVENSVATLLCEYSVNDSTADLQGAGTAGFHISGNSSTSYTNNITHNSFSYFGTDIGYNIIDSDVDFNDDFDAETATEDNPLGNDWAYGTTAIANISVANSKVTLGALANTETRIGSNRVVRPASEARINQKISVEFDVSDFSATSGGANRPRLLARVKNDPAGDGNLIGYYAAVDWGDKIKIGRFNGGTAVVEGGDAYFERIGDGANLLDGTKPSKPTGNDTYRLELYAEQINATTTKLTARYYKVENGAATLLGEYSVNDTTAGLQGAGTAGFHISGNSSTSYTNNITYNSFSYFGTDIGNCIPDTNIDFNDDFDAETATEDNPLGNDWAYGTTAIDNISVANSKVTLGALATVETRIGSNRVVRPASEARINQKVSVEFDASDFSATSGGANRPRLLARVKNDPAGDGNLIGYYVAVDWGDKIKIGRFNGGTAVVEGGDAYFERIGDGANLFDGTKPSKPTGSDIYRLELYAEQVNAITTKLTARYYKVENGAAELLGEYSVNDSTAGLQGAGTAGFHISGNSSTSYTNNITYNSFSYFGTNAGINVPESKLTNLELSVGTIDFNSWNYSYNVKVKNNISAITLKPTASTNDAVIEVNGETVSSGSSSEIALLEDVKTAITVKVTEGTNKSATYTVFVTRIGKDFAFKDDFSTVVSGRNNPLGNDWQYGSTALSNLTASKGVVTLTGGDVDNATNRVVRPEVEAKPNQKVAVEFGYNTFTNNSTGAADRPRVLARIKNNPANDGNVIAYYAEIDWKDKIKIGKLVDGTSGLIKETNDVTDAAYYVPSKPTSGTYRLEFYAEQVTDTTTKLTVKYYQTTGGVDILLHSYSATDDTAELQGEGTAGFHIQGSASYKVKYTSFSYFGSDNAIQTADLSELSLSNNASINLESDVFDYNINVGKDVSTIDVTPTCGFENSLLNINGKNISSGANSGSIVLKPGYVNTITITVTNEIAMGTVYTINVTREYIEIGDVNNDTFIDNDDLGILRNILLGSFNSDESVEVLSNTNRDDTVDIRDFVRIVNQIKNDNDYEIVPSSNTAYLLNSMSGGADEEADTKRDSIIKSQSMDISEIDGQKYYVSNYGDDSAEGTTPETAWKTFANLSSVNSGDVVLFERGGVYRLDDTANGTLKCESGVTYTAYGNGAKPVIYGSATNYAQGTLWSASDTKNIWQLNLGYTDAGIIVFEHGKAVGNKKADLASLENDGDFYHDLNTGILYLYLDGVYPNAKYNSIEIGTNQNIIKVSGNSSDITIDNLALKYTGAHGIEVGQNASDINITNCELGWIGGSYLNTEGETPTRYGNGIQFWLSCNNVKVDNCWIYQIYDAGFTYQGKSSDPATYQNITLSNSLIELCSMSIEVWDATQGTVNNVKIIENILRFAGFGWGAQRGEFSYASHFTDFGAANGNVSNVVIENNTFDCSACTLVRYVWDDAETSGITVSNNSFYQKINDYKTAIHYTAADDASWWSSVWNQSTFETKILTFDPNPNVATWLS